MVEIMFYDAAKDEGLAKMKELSQKVEEVFHAILADTELPDINENVADIRKLLQKETKMTNVNGTHEQG